MKEWQKTYLRRFWGGMIGYMITLPLSLVLLQTGRAGEGIGRFIVAIIPVVPLAYAMMASVNNVQRMDEMQRRIHFEAVVIAILVTGAFTFTYGLLEINELVPRLPMITVAPIMIASWGIASYFVSRKYN